MHTDGGNLFEIFLRLPVLKLFRFYFFCDFTQKYKFSALKKVSLIS